MEHVNPAVGKLVFDQWQRLSARRCAQRQNQERISNTRRPAMLSPP